jgi:hypothetical protein
MYTACLLSGWESTVAHANRTWWAAAVRAYFVRAQSIANSTTSSLTCKRQKRCAAVGCGSFFLLVCPGSSTHRMGHRLDPEVDGDLIAVAATRALAMRPGSRLVQAKPAFKPACKATSISTSPDDVAATVYTVAQRTPTSFAQSDRQWICCGAWSTAATQCGA